MPATNERVANRPLSGMELAKIIEADVHNILSRDGMFTNNIAYSRVHYEVRVSLHLDNPCYPHHTATILPKPSSVQQVAENPALTSLELKPLTETSEESTVVSTEVSRTIASPNAARVEADLPLQVPGKDPVTNAPTMREIKYVGDKPDQAAVGNIVKVDDKTAEQEGAWKVPPKAAKAEKAEKEKK